MQKNKLYLFLVSFLFFSSFFLAIQSVNASEIAYFTESSEYEIQMNQNDSSVMEPYKENWKAYNADINFAKYEENENLNSLFYSSQNNTCQSGNYLLDYYSKEFFYGKYLLLTANTSSTTIRITPQTFTLAQNVSFSSIFMLNETLVSSIRVYFVSGAYENSVLIEKSGTTQIRLRIVNSTNSYFSSSWLTTDINYPFKLSFTIDNLNDKIYASVLNLYSNQSTSLIHIQITDFASSFYFLHRFYTLTPYSALIKLFAIDSNRVLRDNYAEMEIDIDIDSYYTENRILELYNTQDESYACADRMITQNTDDMYAFPFLEPENEYFDYDYDKGSYNPLTGQISKDFMLNQSLQATQDYFKNASENTRAYKSRYRDVSALNVSMNEDYSLLEFDSKEAIADIASDLFSIVFSIQDLEQYLGFYWLFDEGHDSYMLEVAENVLTFSTFYTSFAEPFYELNFTIEEWDLTDYVNEDIGFYLAFSDRVGIEYIDYACRLGNEKILQHDSFTNYANGSVDYEIGTFGQFFYADIAISDGVLVSSGKDANCMIKCLAIEQNWADSEIYNYVHLPISYISNYFSSLEIFDLNYNRYIPISYNISIIQMYDFNMSVLYQNDSVNFTNQQFTVYSDILTFTVQNLTNPWEYYTEFGYIFLGSDYLLPINFGINTDLEEFSYSWEISFIARWVLIYEFADNGWFVILSHAISPLVILISFAVCGYRILKFKGTIAGLILGFVVLFVIDMVSIMSLIILIVILIVMLVYHIKKKGANIDV